jgi:hypothetical protein
MRLLHPFPILIQVFLIICLLRNDAIADDPSCAELLHPMHSTVEAIKAQGGIWGIFDKHYKVRNHAVVTLKLDSTITFLMVALDHICSTQKGIPYGEIAAEILRIIKEKGEKQFMEEMINMGHAEEEAVNLLKFAKFSEVSRTRELDIKQISKTIQESKPLIDRMVGIANKMGTIDSDSILAESKALISDVGKLRSTDIYLKLADFENSQEPNARFLTNNSDAM